MADHTLNQATVYTKPSWSASWELQPALWCDTLTRTVSPGIDSARLHWDYGRIKRQEDVNFLLYIPKTLLGHYVRIEWETDEQGTTENWVGIITHENDTQDGTNTADQRTGRQSFAAVGMEWLLSRDVLSKSVVLTTQAGEQIIERVIDFNAGASNGRGVDFQPNKATGQNVFTSDLSNATSWDARQICDYLLSRFGPKDQYDNSDITYTIPLFQSLDLQNFITQVPANRRTVKDILDALISPYRGLGYVVQVTVTGAVSLNVFSYVADDVSLPGGGTIHANTQQRPLDLQSNLLIQQPTVTYDAASKYDRIVARGERATTTCTLRYQNGIERGWNEEDEATYATAASGETGYDDATIEEQMQWDTAFRSSDAMRKVYSYVVLQDNWNGVAGEEDVDPEQKPFWQPGLRFLPYTTLLEYHDYSADKIAAKTTGENVPAGVVPQQRLPFGIVADVDTRYCYVDQLSQQGNFNETAHTDGRSWSAVVRAQEDMPGLILDVVGAAQHVFAKDDFTAGHDADEYSDFLPELSWKNVEFTATLQLDYHCEAEYPSIINGQREFINTKVIYVPNHRLDYVTPQTVVGVAADGTLQRSEGGYIQDDREKLADIAQMAYQWYRRERVALQYSIRTTRTNIAPGQLITSITTGGTTQQVNTVVTQVMLNFITGVTSVSTGFGELDRGAFS